MDEAHLGGAPAGYRLLPHTADVALEAWAPVRHECVAQAVRALVGCFAEPRAAGPSESVRVALDRGSDEDLLVSALDEVIRLVDVHGRIPVDVSVEERSDGAEIRFETVPISEAWIIGAVPKAVSLHELRFGRTGGTWRCHVIVDV
jgi:SHS2 domain-containing protein